MNTRRILISLFVLTLFPVAAFSQGLGITPAPGTANILVASIFEDGNDEEEIEVVLKCTSGDYDGTPVTLSPIGFGPEDIEDLHIYVISNIPAGPNNVCTVKQAPVDGYETLGACFDESSETEPDEDCSIFSSENDRLSYCQFNEVDEGEVGFCFLLNEILPVDVEVTKVWDISGMGGADYDRFAEVTIGCDAEIEDGYQKGNKWYITFDLYDDEYVDDEGDDIGMATVTAMVYPEWFKTANDPKKQKSTKCWAGEPDVDSAVEVESDCGSKSEPGMSVTAGKGDSCTISNTLFFEGIPTLNQYGMAIMALLMLSMGFVGFRRFV
jgi:hypothetical protein